MGYEPVIGLEVHIQLQTESKIFCSCSTKFGADQNTQVCPICLGMPGVLPVLNKQVVEYAAKLALATDCTVNPFSIFARKNYFYPDLPKGYQISQFEQPFCEHGLITIDQKNGSEKTVRIRRIHMEEDAGKSVHSETYVAADETLLDMNRCGVPLLEMVTEPDLRSPAEAAAFLMHMRRIVRYLGICDGNMEQGSMRCDTNVSLRSEGSEKFGVKTELKNMNSFSHVEKALTYEIERQRAILEEGGQVQQETLLWDAGKNIAEPMRLKEFSHDYRYFPDPDLIPIEMDSEWLHRIREQVPELPLPRKRRLMKKYGLPHYDAEILTEDHALADFFERVCTGVADPKNASNWIMGEILRAMKDRHCDLEQLGITSDQLVELINLIDKGVISSNIAKKILDQVLETGNSPKDIVEQEGLLQVSDQGEIEKIVDGVLAENRTEVEAYKNGKKKLFGFFVGQVMRVSAGKANPKIVNDILKKKLD